MENKLSQVMREGAETKLTENGAFAYNTLDSKLLSLFATIGAMRPRTEEEIEMAFAAAVNEDLELATKMLFYSGDVRGGLGERRTFNICLKWLAHNYPSVVRKNMMLIPIYNRFDSWYTLVDTPVEEDMWKAMKMVYSNDMMNLKKGDQVSLLAKWMKSINSSSKETRRLGKLTAKKLNFLSEKSYRKTLSLLRGRIRVTEKAMSANRWDGIDYSGVPSYAMKRYGRAFGRHDHERFAAYLESVSKGEDKINSSTLYPYDLVKPLLNQYNRNNTQDVVTEAQWKALPDYLNGSDVNVLCMADVSGSMSWGNARPMATSVGLSIYFAERNKGAFKNLYMTFSSKPNFISINPNDTLNRKVQQVLNTGVGYNTNLEGAFVELLKMAMKNRVPKEDMPKALVVISDAEINSFNSSYGFNDYYGRVYRLDFVKTMKRMYAQSGYELPKIILWQVESRQDTFLTKSEDVIWVSGQSASTFKNLVKSIDKTGYDMMLETLNSERYSMVEV